MVLPGLLLWYTLLPSFLEQPLVQTVRSVSHGGFWENFPLLRAFVALFALENLHSPTFALVSFTSSVFGCCLWSTSYWIFREILRASHLVRQWIHVLRGLWTNFTYFLRAVNSDPTRLLSILQWRNVHS